MSWIESHPLGFARCQIYNTYIIAEVRDKLIIVDQHAAHERLVYECLKQKSSIKRQKLLLPETVEIKNQAGMEMIEIYKDKLFGKNLLDKLRQPPYHGSEAIYLSSQSVQVNDKKLRVFGVSCLIFRTTCIACL